MLCHLLLIPVCACNVTQMRARENLSTVSVDNSGERFRARGNSSLILPRSGNCLIFGHLCKQLKSLNKKLHVTQTSENIERIVTTL
jgi:hypothetical protein